jgi:hypothetical protein
LKRSVQCNHQRRFRAVSRRPNGADGPQHKRAWRRHRGFAELGQELVSPLTIADPLAVIVEALDEQFAQEVRVRPAEPGCPVTNLAKTIERQTRRAFEINDEVPHGFSS